MIITIGIIISMMMLMISIHIILQAAGSRPRDGAPELRRPACMIYIYIYILYRRPGGAAPDADREFPPRGHAACSIVSVYYVILYYMLYDYML